MSEEENEKLPVPVSVTLYNLLAPRTEISNDASHRTAWFRPHYTSDLLVPVCLSILLQPKSNQQTEEEALVLFSATQDRGGIHPFWDFLDERTDFWEQQQNEEYRDWDPVYRSLRLKISTTGASSVVLADIPLYPQLLRRLPEDPQQDTLLAWGSSPPPTALPPNAVLVHFSDGSTRVNPPLYHFLLDREVIVEHNPKDASLLQDDAEESRRMERFSDDVFEKLDQATTKHQTTRRPSPSSLLETNQVERQEAVVVSPEETDVNYRGVSEVAKYSLTERFEDGETDTDDDDEPPVTSQDVAVARENEVVCKDSHSFEREELLAMIEMEESCLEHDLQTLHHAETRIKGVLDEVRRIEEEAMAINVATEKARLDRREMDFRLEAQQIKLLRDLRIIYHIKYQPENRYFICGQEIPADVHSNVVPEENLSAALGFLSHVVVMMSKYLSIPLRYRLVCNSSRSAIQDAESTIYPLFQSRAVDRQLLDKGMLLLHQNVDCILKRRGLRCTEKAHILAKVQRIFDGIIDGQ